MGMGWRIGTGEAISIWQDRWLLGDIALDQHIFIIYFSTFCLPDPNKMMLLLNNLNDFETFNLLECAIT